MCRLFGFRSVIKSQVHSSLVDAENALLHQSDAHPDGWGVAYYVANAPHVIKSVETAMDDHLFQRVSGIVASETVLAHLRKTTIGVNSIINTHPFQFGHWVFAHNGNIKNFAAKKEALLARINPELKRFILGDTDSEVVFYTILSKLQEEGTLHQRRVSRDELTVAVNKALKEIIAEVGEFHQNDQGPPTETYLTFLITNGETMLAHQGGKALYYSTYKNKCPERDSCPSFAPECEVATTHGKVNHLIFSSEPLQGQNIWLPLSPGQTLAIDASMEIQL